MNSKEIGQFIAQLRKERKLTQNDLADLLQVTNKAVSRWETGEGFPDIVILPKLAEVLDVSVDEILCGKKSEHADVKQGKPQLRFNNMYLVIHMLLIGSFILFLSLTYITYKVWVGVLGYTIPVLTAIVWFLIEKNRFIFDSEFDNEDKHLIRVYFRRLMITFSVFTSMVLVQLIMVAAGGNFVNSVVSFESYVPISLVVGFIVFVISSIIFKANEKDNLLVRGIKRIQLGAYAVVLILVLILSFNWFSVFFIHIILAACYVLANIGVLIKEKKPWYMLFLILGPYWILSLLFIPSATTTALPAILISVWELVLLVWSVFMWVKRFKMKKHDLLYWISYQNLSLAVAFLCLGIYGYAFGISSTPTSDFFVNIGIFIIIVIIHFITNPSIFYQKEDSKHKA